eukprot:TRINITY_DN28847_c0_g1_i1.p1 TRINITY_DN28847_c0_g1~~TRINITY_DN28847_c0_g1_i1.p1  ORF type:complete len:1562 (+),score=456.93 TRINITY_DN28847_c0_g1_i1:100-4785(+)
MEGSEAGHARGSAAGEAEHKARLDKVLGLQELYNLRDAFKRAGGDDGDSPDQLDEDGMRPLTEREFVAALAPAFSNQGVTDMDLRVLFMRVDAAAQGVVSWRAFSNFLLVNKTREIKQVEVCRVFADEFVQTQEDRSAMHKGIVCKLLLPSRVPRYFSASEDGTVNMWSQSLTLEKTVHSGTAWVTDLCYMPATGGPANDNLAVASVDRVVSVYNPMTGDLVRAFRGRKLRGRDTRREVVQRYTAAGLHHDDPLLPGLQNPDTKVMSHFRKPKSIDVIRLDNLVQTPTALAHFPVGERDRLFVATDAGSVLLYEVPLGVLSDDVIGVPCINSAPHTGGEPRTKYGWDTGHKEGVTCMALSVAVESLITSSTDATIRVLNLERGTQLRTLGVCRTQRPEPLPSGSALERSTAITAADVDGGTDDRGHRKGINSFAWNEPLRLIASCGQERDCLVWNPFIPKPINRLRADSVPGRTAPLVEVVFALEDSAVGHSDAQLITLASDKTVRVWDLRMWRCVQSIRDKKVHTPEDRIGAIAFDQGRQCLITASTQLHARMRAQERAGRSRMGTQQHGHRASVVGAVVMTRLRQVVSCDAHQVVVWELDTQKAITSWTVPEGITALAADRSQRRVLTGTSSGSVLIWNFATAQLLRVCEAGPAPAPSRSEPRRGRSRVAGDVVALLHGQQERPVRARIVGVCQGHRRVLLFPDADGEEGSSRSLDTWDHEDGKPVSYFCMAFAPPSLLLLGTGCGLAVAFLDQVARPAPLPVSCDAAVELQGVFDGPLHPVVETPAPPTSTCGDAEGVEMYLEAVVFLTRTRTIAATARGDGVVGFWECSSDHGGPGGRGEMFHFLAAHSQGDAIHCIATDQSERYLFTGDVSGYVHTYDVSALGEGPIQSAVREVRKVAGFRGTVHSITSLAHVPRRDGVGEDWGSILVGNSAGGVTIWDPTGVVVCRFGVGASGGYYDRPGPPSNCREQCVAAMRACVLRQALAGHGSLRAAAVASSVSAAVDDAARGHREREEEEGGRRSTLDVVAQVFGGWSEAQIAALVAHLAGTEGSGIEEAPSGAAGQPLYRAARGHWADRVAAYQRPAALRASVAIDGADQQPAAEGGEPLPHAPTVYVQRSRPQTAPAARSVWHATDAREAAELLVSCPRAPAGTLARWRRPWRRPAWQRAQDEKAEDAAGSSVAHTPEAARPQLARPAWAASPGQPAAAGQPVEQKTKAGKTGALPVRAVRQMRYHFPPQSRLSRMRPPPAVTPASSREAVEAQPPAQPPPPSVPTRRLSIVEDLGLDDSFTVWSPPRQPTEAGLSEQMEADAEPCADESRPLTIETSRLTTPSPQPPSSEASGHSLPSSVPNLVSAAWGRCFWQVSNADAVWMADQSRRTPVLVTDGPRLVPGGSDEQQQPTSPATASAGRTQTPSQPQAAAKPRRPSEAPSVVQKAKEASAGESPAVPQAPAEAADEDASEWFRKAKRMHPAPSNRHRKYNVSGVPMRAHVHLYPHRIKPVPTAPPIKRLAQKRPTAPQQRAPQRARAGRLADSPEVAPRAVPEHVPTAAQWARSR